MKKYFFAVLFFSLIALAPQMVAAQAPSPYGGAADYMSRMNTYNSWRMNATMNARRRKHRSVKRKKAVRRSHHRRRRTASLNILEPQSDFILISPKRTVII